MYDYLLFSLLHGLFDIQIWRPSSLCKQTSDWHMRGIKNQVIKSQNKIIYTIVNLLNIYIYWK